MHIKSYIFFVYLQGGVFNVFTQKNAQKETVYSIFLYFFFVLIIFSDRD